jgi:hypothetical protein
MDETKCFEVTRLRGYKHIHIAPWETPGLYGFYAL